MDNHLLSHAIAIATEAHKGQKDKYGQEYLHHPIRVMNIEHFPEKKVFQTVVDGETARLMYHVADGALDVRHTIVPGEIGGRGIASALVKAAYDYALANELVPVATCSYAVKWLERHPEYNGKTGKDYAGEGTCAL